jgi:glutaminyl-tRNA synthetase
MYRILDEPHHRQGSTWKVYPSYDWAHGLEDSIEGITHSICTLEFENHRPLYDWFLDALGIHHPRQIEFAKLQLTYTVLSKRNLLHLVTSGRVRGWDDPRMPTVAGMRRRGYTAEALRAFCEDIGVTKLESVIELTRLENAVRDHLNETAPRRMGVLDPLKVVLTNFPEGKVEEVELQNHPDRPEAGTRKVPFARELYIERDDFMETPPKNYFRLRPGGEVRLRGAYFIRCTDVVRDASGAVTELRCTYDPASFGGQSPDGRKVRGTIQWVSAAHAATAEVRLFDRLFRAPFPGRGHEGEHPFLNDLNPDSLRVVARARVEPLLALSRPGERFQFERLGYFAADPDSREGAVVFNRTVALKDTWSKERHEAHGEASAPAAAKQAPAVPAPAKEAPAAAAPTALVEPAEFDRVVLRAGRVLTASRVEGSDKLLHLTIDLGEPEPRTIVSGIAGSFDPAALPGKMVTVVANLKPRKLMGIASRGMLLTAGERPALNLVDPGAVAPGTRVC